MVERESTAGETKKRAEAWFLRTGEDAVHGELTLEAMAEWAETGRILAHHDVSRDSKHWVKAETVPELRMDWCATLKSGATQGPFNLLALPDLCRRGIIDATTILRNKLTNREIPAASILRGVPDPTKTPGQRPPLRKAQTGYVEPPADSAARGPATGASAGLPEVTPVAGVSAKGAVSPPLLTKPRTAAVLKPTELPSSETETVAISPPPPTPPAAEPTPAPAAPTPEPAGPAAIAQLNEEIQKLRKDVGDHKDRIGKLLKNLADEMTMYEELRASHTRSTGEFQRKIDEKQKAIDAKGQQFEEKEKTVADLRKRCDELEAEARQRADQEVEVADGVRQQLRELEGSLRKEQKAHKKSGAAAAESQSQLTAQVAALKGELERNGGVADKRKKDIERLEHENAELKKGHERARAETAGLMPRVSRLEQDKEGLRQANDDLRNQAEGLKKQEEKLRQELERQQQEAEKARRRAEELEGENAERARELEALGRAAEPTTEEAKWYLRLEGDQVFGPVGLTALCEWAADCRVGPGQQVSQDQKTWKSAEELPQLRMEWNVTLVNGTEYGPLNAFAIPHLIRDEAVAPDASIVNRDSGEKKVLADLLIAETKAIRAGEAELAEEVRRQGALVAAMKKRVEEQRPAAPPQSIRSRLLVRSGSGASPDVNAQPS